MRMTKRAIEIRASIIETAIIDHGASETEIRAMAADPRAREILNAMCQASADAEESTNAMNEFLKGIQ